MAKVVLKNITKRFGKKTILDDISLEIKDKEFVVLVGASGCGKSTLLRTIAGLEKPTSGEIYIGSKCVNGVLPKDRDIAMVFQSYALYPHLSVYDNMAFGLTVRKTAKCEIKRRVNNAAEILGLEDYLDYKPRELSGGQRQRVALGRVRVAMRSEIKKLHKKLNTTFIYVTHDQTEALTMGDRIVVLDKGKIQQADSAQNIYNHPKNTFVATFMGTYPMNLFPATIEDGLLNFANIYVNLATTPVDYPKNVKDVIVGIRVEDIVDKTNASYPFNLIKFTAVPDFEETLGADKVVYFKTGDVETLAKVPAEYARGSAIEFSINPMKLKFFDAKTKEALN